MRCHGRRSLERGTLLAAILALTGCDGGPPPAPDTVPAEIARRLGTSCLACHHAGGPAPFDLETAGAVARRGRAVTGALRSGFMPPWLPATGDVPLRGDRRIPPDEVERIAAWVASDGAVDDATPIRAPAFPAIERDLVVAPESAIELGASRRARLIEFTGSVPEGRATLIDGAELLDARGRVGHALVRVESASGAVAALHLSPATGPWLAPAGGGWRVEPGDRIVVRLYVPPSAGPVVLTPSLALSFRDEEGATVLRALRSEAQDVRLPRRDAAVIAERSTVLDGDATLVEVLPDAHLFCRSITVRAERPDGASLVLLDIPAWDLAWQEAYRPATPVPLPAGTRIVTTWSWDNSRANPRNPHDPLEDVTPGPTLADAHGAVWLSLAPGLY